MKALFHDQKNSVSTTFSAHKQQTHLLADLALKGPLARVHVLVRLEVTLLREALHAHVSGMATLVSEICGRKQRGKLVQTLATIASRRNATHLLADVALERLLL